MGITIFVVMSFIDTNINTRLTIKQTLCRLETHLDLDKIHTDHILINSNKKFLLDH